MPCYIFKNVYRCIYSKLLQQNISNIKLHDFPHILKSKWDMDADEVSEEHINGTGPSSNTLISIGDFLMH